MLLGDNIVQHLEEFYPEFAELLRKELNEADERAYDVIGLKLPKDYKRWGCREGQEKDPTTDTPITRSATNRVSMPQRGRRGKAAEPAHGTRSRYISTNWSCRCTLCTKANRDYQRERVVIKREELKEYRRLRDGL